MAKAPLTIIKVSTDRLGDAAPVTTIGIHKDIKSTDLLDNLRNFNKMRQDSADAGNEIFDKKTEHNGPSDAMRHILFNAKLATATGSALPWILDKLHEYVETGLTGQPRAEMRMDLANGEIGRDIGRMNLSDAEMVNAARKAVEEGKAVTLGKDTYNNYAKGGEVMVDEDGKPVATPLEDVVQQQFGLEPNLDRAALLPYKSKDKGWIAPAALYDIAKLVASPIAALHGKYISPEEAVQSGITLGSPTTAAGLLSKAEPATARMFLGAKNAEYVPPHETPQFKAWSNDAPLITSEAAKTHDFKTGEPVALEAYHGTKRPDRVGDVFLAKRATSGPMAFHTSDPELASGYATNKRDTSLAYEDTDYNSWFKMPVPGRRKPVNLDQAWSSFTPEEKKRISDLAPRVGYSDDGEKIIIHPEGHGSGIGNYDWEIKQTKSKYNQLGNPLKALTESWLTSGSLYNQEARFMEVLKKAGVPTDKVIFDDPTAEMPFVYKNYIKMQSPLVTSDIPDEVGKALNAAAAKDRSRPTQGASDPWDKKNRTLRDWVEEFNLPDNQHAWTSIPDKVTNVFRDMGYDGIIDYSGKNGAGQPRPVYIPFGEHQIKSAIGNKGKFDPAKKSLTLGLAAPVIGGGMLLDNKDKESLFAKYAKGGGVTVDEDGKKITPLEQVVQQQFGLEPNLDRATLLPYKSKDKGWVAPAALYDIAKLVASPIAALHGTYISPEEAIQSGITLGSPTTAAGLVSKTEPAIASMFIGPKSKAWDETSHALALRMEKEGAHPREIWKQTMNWRQPSGQWAQEISDASSWYTPDKAKAEALKRYRVEADKLVQARGIFKDALGIRGIYDDLTREAAPQLIQPKASTLSTREWNDKTKALKESLKQQAIDEYKSSLKTPLDDLSIDAFRAMPSWQLERQVENYQPKYHGLTRPSDVNIKGVMYKDILSHPDLFAAYPSKEFAPFRLRTGREMGVANATYNPSTDEITLSSTSPDKRSSLLHEMQHSIQNLEGWEGGASPDQFKASSPLLSTELYRRNLGEGMARATQARRDITLPDRRHLFPADSFSLVNVSPRTTMEQFMWKGMDPQKENLIKRYLLTNYGELTTPGRTLDVPVTHGSSVMADMPLAYDPDKVNNIADSLLNEVLAPKQKAAKFAEGGEVNADGQETPALDAVLDSAAVAEPVAEMQPAETVAQNTDASKNPSWKDLPRQSLTVRKTNYTTGNVEEIPTYYSTKKMVDEYDQKGKTRSNVKEDIDTNILHALADAQRINKNISISPEEMTALLMQEGRTDFGATDLTSTDKAWAHNPQAVKLEKALIDMGHNPNSAGMAALMLEKQQVAKRKGVPWQAAWNGLGKTSSGRTWKDYVKEYNMNLNNVGANKDALDYIRAHMTAPSAFAKGGKVTKRLAAIGAAKEKFAQGGVVAQPPGLAYDPRRAQAIADNLWQEISNE